MKIHEDSLKTFQVVERTRLRRNLVMVEVPYRTDTIETQFGDGGSSMGNNSKSINARVMVLAICISSNAG